jgi:hypothetical protein
MFLLKIQYFSLQLFVFSSHIYVQFSTKKKQKKNSYFYTPPNGDYSNLVRFGQFNTQSVGSLFVEFFHYMTLQFDPADDVISVRVPRVSKLTKIEQECW